MGRFFVFHILVPDSREKPPLDFSTHGWYKQYQVSKHDNVFTSRDDADFLLQLESGLYS